MKMIKNEFNISLIKEIKLIIKMKIVQESKDVFEYNIELIILLLSTYSSQNYDTDALKCITLLKTRLRDLPIDLEEILVLDSRLVDLVIKAAEFIDNIDLSSYSYFVLENIIMLARELKDPNRHGRYVM